MKEYRLLVWLTQLGLSVAVPLVGFPLLAIWLQSRFGWGDWVLWVAVVIGIISAVDGFRTSLKAMSRLSRGKKKSDAPTSFNEHD